MNSKEIRENVDNVRQRIESAARRSGRKEEDILLVAVSKFMPPERIAWAMDAGISAFGENRAQEFRDKQPIFPQSQWHFIGQLQKNKVKYIVGKAQIIQSVDSIGLLECIDAQAKSCGAMQSVLLEVNIGNEPQKGGLPLSAVDDFLAVADRCANVRLDGLMCVPPAGEDSRPFFQRMRERYEQLSRNLPLRWLSMGMSADFECAIEEGSNMVRVGSAIFGPRPLQGE